MNINDRIIVTDDDGAYGFPKGYIGIITEKDTDEHGKTLYRIDGLYWHDAAEIMPWDGGVLIDIEGNIERHGNWYDIPLPTAVSMKAGEYAAVNLGIKTKMPPGYEAHVIARSSTFRKFGVLLANSVGLIDYDYNKPWQAMLYATKDIEIPAGTRLVQFTIVKTLGFSLNHTKVIDKGRGYSGSTGY